MRRVILVLFAALSGLSAAMPVEQQTRPRWILHAALFAAQYGGGIEDGGISPDGRSEFLALGVGHQIGRGGVLVSTRLIEAGAGVGGGDFRTGGGFFPLYLEFVYGVSDRWVSPGPTLHVFVSGSPWLQLHRTKWLRAGIGAKWRVYAASPELELSYVHLQNEAGSRNALSAFMKLELGGWWLLGRKSSP